MKTRISATIILAVLVTSCVTTPKTPEEIQAAGWVEVATEPRFKGLGGLLGADYKKWSYHPVYVKLGFDPLNVKYKDGTATLSTGTLISSVTAEFHGDVLYKVRYRTPKGKLVDIKERRWGLIPRTTNEYIGNISEYTIDGKIFPGNNLSPLAFKNREEQVNAVIQIRYISKTVKIPLNLLFNELRMEYEALKKKYVIPKNKNANNPDLNNAAKLLSISYLLGDFEYSNKLIADYESIDKTLQAAKEAEEAAKKVAETAKRNRIEQEARLFSTYQDFADNARTNIAMLNNPSYWQQGIVYKLVFGGSDVSLNSEYVKAANPTMEGAYANALVQLAQGLLGEALVNQATGRRGTPSADSKYVVFMMHTITEWPSRTRFSSTVMTENGVYPLHIEASTMIDYIQKIHPDGFSYCRGYFVVEQLSPTLVLRPIQLGPIELWQVERDTGVGFDEIIKSAMSK
jgi:hypothetical protein